MCTLYSYRNSDYFKVTNVLIKSLTDTLLYIGHPNNIPSRFMEYTVVRARKGIIKKDRSIFTVVQRI